MKFGKEKYKVKSSEVYLKIRPGEIEYLTLSVNIWSESSETYWIVEPIKLVNPECLIQNCFQSDFKIQEIIDIDSTLLVKNEAINIWYQKMEFDNYNLFKLKEVNIIGETFEGKKLSSFTATSFRGFEIWKNKNYSFDVKKIQGILKELSIDYSTLDETENELIRIELTNRA